MNAPAFRHVFAYHFLENRTLWDRYVTHLSAEQFTHPVAYAHGSVRDQIVHLMHVDDLWFSELRGVEPLAPPPPAVGDDRSTVRAHWDRVEHRMAEYLAALRDAMLLATAMELPDEDHDLMVWQVLLQVVNHGTDHRAQLLRVLHELGCTTTSQDYIFYAYKHRVPQR